MLNGLLWSAVEKYSGMAVSLVVSMVLARLLTSEEFGVVAVATVIINFLSIFATMGIGPAVIQRKDFSENDLNNIFTFSIFSGGLTAAVFFCLSWVIADIYNNQNLVVICQVLSINLFFAAANMVPNALMSRDLKFKLVAKRTLILQISSGIISVLAAFYGFEIYSLLISPTFTAVGIFVYNRSHYQLHLQRNFDWTPMQSIASYSSYQFAFEFVNYFSRNLDKLIIGKYINLADLGYYEKSYRLMQMPLNSLTGVVNPVLQPIMSRLQEQKQEIAQKHNKMIGAMASISFPLGIGLYIFADLIIRTIYGNKWDNAIPTFQILSLSVPLQVILSTSGGIFQSCGDTKTQFRVGIRNTVTTVVSFIIAIYWIGTIEAVAWAWTISLIINFFCSYMIMYMRVLKSPFKDMLKSLLLPFATLVVIWVVNNQLLNWETNVIIRLIVFALFSLSLIKMSGVVELIKRK